ncbi:glycosyltransferase family 1 protein [uncultured Clostridium sp.]|uniref:glycosyltransferase family 4 protein n=1 Tax=uncultured Clostridium sp. TaxID=59620 RepID=UPI0026396991|nr:glycosyltransferase family 1 protein [uncultured Clostridium sp.]
MKIGIDGRAAEWYRGTGIGTYTYQLISNLNKIDNINDYLLFSTDNLDIKNLNENFTLEKVLSNTSTNFWENVKVPNILTSTNIDLYHIPQNGVGLSSNISCKKTITLHDIIPLRMPETVSDRYLRIFNDEMPKIIDNCDGIITVSEFSKEDIANEFNYPKDKIFVTHLAAEDIYKPLSKSTCQNIIREKYNIDKNFILYVGGFSPRKNILGLIEAYSLLSNSLKNSTYLVITGNKGISYERYLNRARELKIEDKVIFTGFIPLDDLPIFYNACETLVYPSFYEGFGLPPLEAMACGVPVIASNRTSLPEVCTDSAILINPSNTQEIAEKITKVLSDSFLKLSMVNCSLRASKKFSFEKTALKTLEAYKAIVK